MFDRLGNFVARTWQVLLVGWVLLFAILFACAPKWEDVVNDGEFKFLPADAPSRKGEALFEKAFSNDLLGSTLVVVARRETSSGLLDEDRTYVEETLVPRIEKAVGYVSTGGPADEKNNAANESAANTKNDATASASTDKDKSGHEKALREALVKEDLGKDPIPPSESIVSKVRTASDKEFGQLLNSEDQKASLIILELTTDFTELRNRASIEQIERLIGHPGQPGELQREKGFPTGLDISLSGSATVGRDMREAARGSAKATERATLVLVICLLFIIYRAPILAVIPLVTVAISVKIALLVLAILAQRGIVTVFSGIEVYVTVVLYGAGVDYCMFLMARYKEELDNGATFDEAIAISVGRVGHALAASAGTVMCGIGMMVFTRFGKFQDAGIAMSSSLIFVLAASLTLTPALLRLAGRWTFWPRVQSHRLSNIQGWISPTSALSRLMEREWFGQVWEKIGRALVARPGTIWITAILLMAPFTVIAIMWQHNLSYGLLSELPPTDPCVVGSAAVQAHFPAGVTGPISLLVANRSADFHTDADIDDEKKPSWTSIESLVDGLYADREKLGIADIRSVAYPLGMTERVQMSGPKRRILLKRAQSQYVSDKPGYDGQVTRINIVLNNDPFSPDSMSRFDRLKEAVLTPKTAAGGYLPTELNLNSTDLQYVGATPSIRDLKWITGVDQLRIDFLVPTVVFLILVVLLRRVATSAYLIFTVFFSYFVTLGVTFLVFYLVNPHGFAGLDWKVPMFLFTILVAVGEDYNILLMTRIEEEQRNHGPVEGVIVGLRKTGSIISSCGVIMAGTFSALMAGNLEGLAQLGFALAFGVLLDTFVVRPILVPAYLILLYQGWFGALGRFLGANPRLVAIEPTPRRVAVGTEARDA